MIQPDLFDVCARKHLNAPTSVEANKRVDKSKDRAFILALIEKNGTTYSKEAAREMNKPLNAISGRFSELRYKEKAIELVAGLVIEGCQVFRRKI